MTTSSLSCTGPKLRGGFALTRTAPGRSILVKTRDDAAEPVPEWMNVRLVASGPMRLRSIDWELRALRAMATDPWLVFHDGRPRDAPPGG